MDRCGLARAGRACAGLLTSLLLVDDLFMFHDWFAIYELGIDERLVFATYGVLVAGFLIGFRDLIRASDSLLLALALGFFAVSLAVDAVPPETVPIQHLYEDGAKLLGIVSWLACFAGCSLQALAPARPLSVSATRSTSRSRIDRWHRSSGIQGFPPS